MTSEQSPSTDLNRLAQSTSPYLRQHAGNPVDWFEWGSEALERAAAENKPILLSVGYSSCHWCHVMAHESFEDPAMAAVMNERFINIKVDREERPDIDAIYQRVVQLMGEGGGWPLTVFLLPDQRPFYGGTYFPPQSKYGRPGFSQLLHALSDLHRDEPDRLEAQAESFIEGFARIAEMAQDAAEEATGDPELADPAAIRVAAKRLLSKIDPELGGFGREPKFPNSSALEVLAAVGRSEGSVASEAIAALDEALTRMRNGGIYDHLRGGFARYSTDRRWLVPHFEKMLYDNAQLLPLYAEAAVRVPEQGAYRQVVNETIEYLAHDMRTPDGTFFAATDADSEGVEGKYFCWTPSELTELLGDAEVAEQFGRVYDVTESGNFEHGWSILHLPATIASHAEAIGVPLEALQQTLAQARQTLLAHRYTRVPPHRDDKVLTSWNALLAHGLLRSASAADAWGDTRLATNAAELALACLEHLFAHHVGPDGRVLRASFEGQVHTRGTVDDVAYLARAALDAHERTLEPKWLDRAAALAEHACGHYLRGEGDGFLLTADDAEALIERPEALHDGPIPSGVGVMVEVLARLGAAERAPDAASQIVTRVQARLHGALVQPIGYASLLTASLHTRPDAVHVTVRGPSPADPEVKAMAALVRTARYTLAPAVSLAYVTAEPVSAIVCRGQVCTAPLPSCDALADALRHSPAPR